MRSFYAQAFADLAVYRPTYTPSDWGFMPLMPTVEEVFRRELNNFVESGQVTIPAGQFFAAIGASVFELATQIDALRDDLVAKGLLESL
jgi:hypothetical protein